MPIILHSKRVNKSNGMRAAILAAVVALVVPSTVLADDCANGRVDQIARIAACTNILKSNPSSFHALANRGVALNGTGEYGRALADLTEAFQHAHVGELAGLYLERGRAHEGLGNHKLAIADFSEAIGRDPSLIVAYFGRATAYEATGQGELATADLDKAIQLDPKMVAALYMQRGYALRSAHQYAEAIVAFDKAIDLNPNWPLACFGRGASYEEKGDWILAAANYRKCLEFKATTELVRQRQQQAREQLEKHI
jgi:tetratricopeptide (TPR) repeat protein